MHFTAKEWILPTTCRTSFSRPLKQNHFPPPNKNLPTQKLSGQQGVAVKCLSILRPQYFLRRCSNSSKTNKQLPSQKVVGEIRCIASSHQKTKTHPCSFSHRLQHEGHILNCGSSLRPTCSNDSNLQSGSKKWMQKWEPL